jgi:RNA polymerase sigma-32 factor
MNPSVGTPAHALTMANPWSMVPALGNLDAYISAVNRLPLLTPEEEQAFARKLRDHNDLEAAGKLVLWSRWPPPRPSASCSSICAP